MYVLVSHQNVILSLLVTKYPTQGIKVWQLRHESMDLTGCWDEGKPPMFHMILVFHNWPIIRYIWSVYHHYNYVYETKAYCLKPHLSLHWVMVLIKGFYCITHSQRTSQYMTVNLQDYTQLYLYFLLIAMKHIMSCFLGIKFSKLYCFSHNTSYISMKDEFTGKPVNKDYPGCTQKLSL